MNVTKARKFWRYRIGNYESSVQELPDGRWMGDMRLSAAIDPNGTSAKQEVFSKVEDSLRYVGFPVDFVPIPSELI